MDCTKERANIVADDAKEYEKAQKESSKKANEIARKTMEHMESLKECLDKEKGGLKYKIIAEIVHQSGFGQHQFTYSQ